MENGFVNDGDWIVLYNNGTKTLDVGVDGYELPDHEVFRAVFGDDHAAAKRHAQDRAAANPGCKFLVVQVKEVFE